MTTAPLETTNAPTPAYVPPMTPGGLPLPDANAVPAARKIEPLRPSALQTRAAGVLDFSAVVPAATLREDLLDGDFWVHAVGKLLLYSEIRVMWEDGSKYARLLVTHTAGRFSRFSCLEFHKLEELVDMKDVDHPILVKQRGPMKWCLEDAATGDKIKTMIPTQIEALKERDDLYRARGR